MAIRYCGALPYISLEGIAMIDLHTHSIFSDGELIPSELARRAAAKGYRAIAITDHADHSNLDFIIPRMVAVCEKISEVSPLQVIPGIELTHVHPDQIASLAGEARALGARIIVVHGETIVEPGCPGGSGRYPRPPGAAHRGRCGAGCREIDFPGGIRPSGTQPDQWSCRLPRPQMRRETGS